MIPHILQLLLVLEVFFFIACVRLYTYTFSIPTYPSENFNDFVAIVFWTSKRVLLKCIGIFCSTSEFRELCRELLVVKLIKNFYRRQSDLRNFIYVCNLVCGDLILSGRISYRYLIWNKWNWKDKLLWGGQK